MIKQIFCGIILGFIIIIISLQNDPYINKIISDGFKEAFENALDCTIDCTIDKVDFLQPGIHLSNVTVTPRNGAQGWSWTAARYDMYCSWWHLITKGIVNLHVDMEEVVAHSHIVKGDLAIMPHLQKMAIGDPNVPMFVNYINLKHATFTVVDPDVQLRGSLSWDSKTIRQNDRLESKVQILDGFLSHQLKTYLHSCNGELTCGVNETGSPDLIMRGSLVTTVDHIFSKPLACNVNTVWNYDQGTCALVHDDQIFTLKECRFKTINECLSAHAVVDFQMTGVGALPSINIPLYGKGSMVIDGLLSEHPELHVAIALKDIGYDKKIYMSAASINAHYKNEQVSGRLLGQTSNGPLEIRLKSQDDQIHVTGSFDTYNADALISCKEQWNMQHAHVYGADKKNIIMAHSSANFVDAEIDLACLSPLLKKYALLDLCMQGQVQTQLSLKDNLILCAAKMDKCFIRIADTFNGITQGLLQASFNCAENSLSLDRGHVRLNEGTISCNHATLKLAKDNSLESCYANIIIDRALFNVLTSIDLYLSGNLIIKKSVNQNTSVSGAIILDEFELRQNPLSTSFITKIAQATSMQSSSIDIPLNCNLSITTKKPIQVVTPWLHMTARARVVMSNTCAEPILSGSISLDKGVIWLPYKPLIITHGLVTFDPGHIGNPFVELMAKNTIKHHEVSMQIAGPLQQLNICLLSNPVLPESQIISLLLSGSTYGSLSSIVPSLALYSIKNLLFDIEQSPLKLSEGAHEWLEPLRSVYFVPLFDDQRARGGLRGAFEIEVTDRLHALIQRNFTLTEDTRFELEYALSDNISIRGVRDERRDVNGQIEMRWKF